MLQRRETFNNKGKRVWVNGLHDTQMQAQAIKLIYYPIYDSCAVPQRIAQ